MDFRSLLVVPPTYFCHVILQRGISMVEKINPVHEVYDQKIDVLRNIVGGAISTEAVKVMVLSNHTVGSYVSDLQRKIGGHNQQNLIAF